MVKCTTGRRTKLPTPKPSTEDLSLWNLMKRNIGKDLSKVSMPVVLNEPIGIASARFLFFYFNLLQRDSAWLIDLPAYWLNISRSLGGGGH